MKKTIWLALAGLLVAIQFIQPNRSVHPIDPTQDIRQTLLAPATVQSVLVAACYDCHSYESKYPWYSRVAPVSWWVSNHIAEGRKELNFSTFSTLAPEDRAEALEDAAEAVQKGEMPLESYVWMHPAAKLSAAQRDLLVRWFQANGGQDAAENVPTEAGKATRGAEKSYSDDDD